MKGKLDFGKLTKKVITDKTGKRTTKWVRINKDQPKERTKKNEKDEPLKSKSVDKNSPKGHKINLFNDFAKNFKNENTTIEQIEGAIALMEIRAKNWSIETGNSPDLWYSQIKGIKNGEFETKDIKFQIVGEKAKLNEEIRANLDIARQMETDGKDSESIYLATGWERGADEKWRNEIPDIETKKSVNKFTFSAAVETLKDGKLIIHALQAPDFSTMVHEIAHVFEKDLTKEEKKTVEKHGGSEVFATSFEKYVLKGKTKNKELKPLFDKFKGFLTSIYSKLSGAKVAPKIQPEIKQIFERLLNPKPLKVKKTKKLKKAIVKGLMKPSFLELYKSLDKSKLTKKVLIDKHGHKITRWVKIVKQESKQQHEFIGYRNAKSSEQGKYGTFYNFKKPAFYKTNEVKLNFKNPLILTQKEVESFEGLSLESLFEKWFSNDYDLRGEAKKQGIETGELIDKLVTKEAVKRGYDGIICGKQEIIDLKTHKDFNKKDIKPIKQTETKEFKDWFGDSKVVNDKGEPLVVYRGQKEDLGSEFKYGVKLMPNKATTNEFAFFFTDNTQTASDYAGDGNITPVYIKSEKILDLRPLGFSPTEKQLFEYIGEKGIVLYKKKYSKEYTPMYKIFDKYGSDLKYDIISAGFDGVIFSDSTAQGNTYAVFSPTQIKSATGNNGKFDSKNPDITKCIVRRKLFFK